MQYRLSIDLFFERKLSRRETALLLDRIDRVAKGLFPRDCDGFGLPFCNKR